jgi:hypothetical protein
VVVVSEDGMVHALDKRSGADEWSFELGSVGVAAPAFLGASPRD